jgi:hypothetical protein
MGEWNWKIDILNWEFLKFRKGNYKYDKNSNGLSEVFLLKIRKNYTIGQCDWPKLQITHYDIKNNCKVSW